ncbi:MAG: hypothetical protein E7662_02240 [Ruminococcaceae bacterium]|nr:hypothetical protein [Oscillospiraceae bacterium]
MRIIDCHIHVKGGDVFKTEHTAEQIIPVLDRAGIEKAVIFAMCLSPVEANEMVLRECAKAPERLFGFAYARPMYDRSVTSVIRDGLDRGLRGIKIHKGETLLLPEIIGPVVELAMEYDVPCLIDSGGDHDALRKLVVAYPEAKFIFAHLTKGTLIQQEAMFRFLAPYKNVYVDTSWLQYYYMIRKAVDILGSGRVLYGSDGILTDPRTEIMKVKIQEFTPEQEEDIFYNNIAALLKID